MSAIPAMIATQAAPWYSRSESGAGTTTGGGAPGDGGIDGLGVSLIPRMMPQVGTDREGSVPGMGLITRLSKVGARRPHRDAGLMLV